VGCLIDKFKDPKLAQVALNVILSEAEALPERRRRIDAERFRVYGRAVRANRFAAILRSAPDDRELNTDD